MAKILIVEDETIVAWDIKETLEKLGHTVLDLVVSGTEALGSVITERPDLVLMDIRLEGEMDGIAAGDRIYHQLNIPVVYLTAHADELTLVRATKTDPFGYIIKPFQSQSLQSTIKVAIQRHQVEESARLTQAALANTLNSIGGGIITTDRQGLVTFINPIAECLTGWDATDAIGVEIDRIFCLVWETDGTPIENPNLRAMRLKQQMRSPDRCWLMPRDAQSIPISDTANPIYNSDGEIVGSIVVFQNSTDRLTAEMDLWERNQDLEFSQLQLIANLETKTAEYQQSIACIHVLDSILTKTFTTTSTDEVLAIAIEQLGTALNADYCWVTLHNAHNTTANIVSEFINTKHKIYPTTKIGKEIDLLLYPQFYNHLFEVESWIDPHVEIIPKPYLDLWTPEAQMLICPITIESILTADGSIREIGIITNGNPPWTSQQAHLIVQILNYAVKLATQPALRSTDTGANLDLTAISLSLQWLHNLEGKFSNSIAEIAREMHISAEMLQQQIYSFNVETENRSLVQYHQILHHKLSTNLDYLQAEWHRQFQLIDTLIDLQTNGNTFHLQSQNDIMFRKWIAEVVEKCADLAERYHQDFSYELSGQLLPILTSPFPDIELIILELFNNACKYTPPYHPIALEIEILVDRLQLSIVSFGIEISTQELDKMFVPFAQNSSDLYREHSVTGLGLALVEKIIPHLDGKMQINSERNSTSLIITIPMIGRDLQN
jgi:PAS domain S-box-containing protein